MRTPAVCAFALQRGFPSGWTTRHISLALLLVLSCSLFSFVMAGPLQSVSYVEDKRVGEYELKAVYLYNFLQFVYWPEPVRAQAKDGVMTIGIVGSSPFGTALDELKKSIRENGMKPVRIVQYGPYADDMNLTSCNLLFVGPSEKRNFHKIIASLKNAPVLTVGDTENFIAAGGMINLVQDKGKIRWIINRAPVEKAGLRLSSQILGIALRVVD
ncbi:MAG: YfiR family protein [Nitrospirae bacterium]|nr:MAG: YfiR family protein [Nitrospirota bacterium]